ncbi:NosD domain-containing protein [Jeotgalibacillus marinus]
MNVNEGINLDNSNKNTITGNTANNNTTDGILLTNNSSSNKIIGNTINGNGEDGIFLNAVSNENDVFVNRAFGNGVLPFFDIENLGTNNFKGNKCDTSNQPNICN